MLRWLALLAAAGAAAIVPVCLAAAAVQAAVISLEGFGRALRASHQGDYATERGIEAASSWEYAVDTAEEVAWETAPVPALGPGDTLALVFSCGLSRGHGEHTLAVDGVPRVVFATGAHRADTTWTGDQATLRFEPLLEDASGDVHGVMCLSLPGSLARAGQPLVLRVQGNPGGKGGWFMLHHFPDAGQYVRDGIVRLPSGRRLLLGPPRSLFAGQEWIEWSCPPALGGAAGAAPVDRLRLVATLAPVAAPPPGAPSVRAWTAEVAVGPAPARTRIRLWPTAQVGAGNHWLSLELQDAAGARCGRWQGQVAIRELTEFARLLAQAQAALAAVPVPPQGAAALADIAHASLSQALQRLPARPAQWATAAQLEAELPQLEQETRAVLAAVDRLRRGEDPYAGRTGFMLKAYRSALDGRLQPYGLFVPASPAPAAGYPLVVMLHGYTSTPTLAMRRVFGIAAAQDAPFTDHGFVVATPYNRDNIGYGNPLGEDDVWRVVEDVRRACPIDADRVYLTGLSMGGHGTVHLGLRHADRFAAIASVCGASDWRVWADRPVAELRARVLDSTNELPLADNALHLPVKLCHGDADATVNVEHSRRLAARLRELGYAVEYEEYPGVGHNAWDRAYADGRIFAWFRPFVRPRYPERVVLVTAEPARYGRTSEVTRTQ